MVLFLVRHQHTDETCPAPTMGPMLLQHLSEANTSQMPQPSPRCPRKVLPQDILFQF